MDQAEASRLLDGLLARKHNVRWGELIRTLFAFGYELRSTKGSHHYFSHPSARGEILPVHGTKAKAVYVELVVKACRCLVGGLSDGNSD
jgi:predicted RNA binding protein YcfA (HicA-like mRNA interferase family)